MAALKPDESELPGAPAIELGFGLSELPLVGPVDTILDDRDPDSEVIGEVGEPSELVISEIDDFKRDIVLPDKPADDTAVAVEDEALGLIPNPATD